MRSVILLLCLAAVGCVGPEGEQGPPGPPGEAGAAASLSSYVACSTTSPVGGVVLDFVQQRYVFSDGSVLLGCEVRDIFYGYTSNIMFKAGQEGATMGVCVVQYDIDSASSGTWDFRLPADSTTATATYRDSRSALNGAVMTLQCQKF